MRMSQKNLLIIFGVALAIACAAYFLIPNIYHVAYDRANADVATGSTLSETVVPKTQQVLDTVEYDKRMLALANNPVPPPPAQPKIITNKDGTTTTIPAGPAPIPPPAIWPAKAVY